MNRTALALSCLALAACGDAVRDDLAWYDAQPQATFHVGDVGVRVHTAAPWAQAPDFPARVEEVIRRAAAYFGGSPEALAGWVISFEDGPVDCDETVGGRGYLGCTVAAYRTITVSKDVLLSTGPRTPAVVAECVEATSLAHEVGHAVLGDACHRSRRWRSDAIRALELTLQYDVAAVAAEHCRIWDQSSEPTCEDGDGDGGDDRGGDD